MKRGFFSGLVWGALSAVFVIVVGLVFQSFERIQMPEAEAFEVPAGSEFTRSREDQAASLPAPVEAPQQLAKTPAEAPQPVAPDVAPDEDVASATVPKSTKNKLTGLSTSTLPQTETNLPVLSDSAKKPTLSADGFVQPGPPNTDFGLNFDLDPAQPVFPKQMMLDAPVPGEPQAGLDLATAPSIDKSSVAAPVADKAVPKAQVSLPAPEIASKAEASSDRAAVLQSEPEESWKNLSSTPDPDPTASALASTSSTFSSIPSGTVLAQLGAFRSADIAEQEWQRLSAKFSEQLNGLEHVVQMAEVNGRIFHRLRVVGLEDLAEASAFCETFVARNTACLPVVMR